MPHLAARRSRLSAAVTALMTLAAAAGCAAAPAEAAPGATADPVITVAAVPATGAVGLYIAQDLGLFRRAGLTVRIESSISAADTISDLLAGRIQITLGQWTSAVAAEARGTRLRALAAGNDGGPGLEQLMTLPGSRVTQLGELRGQAIAVNATGGLSQMLTEAALAPYGISGSQVRWAVYPFPAMAKALAAHRVAAAFMVEPYLSVGEESLGIEALADVDSGSTFNFPVTGYFTTQSWAARHPATAAAFTAALEQGQEIAATSRAEVEKAIIAHIPNPAGAVVPMRVTASVMALGSFPVGQVNPVQLGRVADLMVADGLLPPGTDTAAVIRALVTG